MTVVLLIAAAAAAYQVLAIAATLRHLARKDPVPQALPPVSILKPLRGMDPNLGEALRSHALLDYPEYEVLVGVADPADPAAPEARRLAAEYPGRVRMAPVSTQAPNGKVGALIDLAKAARYPLLLVNDSDIRVTPEYLRRLVGWLEDPAVGLVTCLYRATAHHWPGRWEALGIATDFAPSVLVAPFAGVVEFGLGSTLLFRREDLEAVGGFEALAAYLADDYQLGKRITQTGRRVVLARLAVETCLSGSSWAEVWNHQVRWARTIRVSRGAYLGLPVANASLWALAAFAAGAWWTGAGLLALRLVAGLLSGWAVLKSPDVVRYAGLMPLRDLWGFAVWVWGLRGDTVEWRGRRLRLTSDGRIQTLD